MPLFNSPFGSKNSSNTDSEEVNAMNEKRIADLEEKVRQLLDRLDQQDALAAQKLENASKTTEEVATVPETEKFETGPAPTEKNEEENVERVADKGFKGSKVQETQEDVDRADGILREGQGNPVDSDLPVTTPDSAVLEAVNQIKGQLDRMEKVLADDLAEEKQKRGAVSEKLADRQTKYENLMQTVQEDRYRKDKVKLINRVIFFTDLIRRMLYDFNTHRDSSQPKNEETLFLEQQFEKIIETMDDTLRHEMVTTLPLPCEGDDFQDEYMEVIDTIETDNDALAGKVQRAISACYIWTLPYILKARLDENGNEVRHYQFVLHPAEVIVYRLVK